MQAWLAEINEYAQDDVVIMLLGNKADVANERMVQMVEGNQLAKACDQIGSFDYINSVDTVLSYQIRTD